MGGGGGTCAAPRILIHLLFFFCLDLCISSQNILRDQRSLHLSFTDCYCRPSSSGVVLILIIVVIVCCVRNRRKRRMQVKGNVVVFVCFCLFLGEIMIKMATFRFTVDYV